ncbi:M20/M25/M40 family metallo-hydrolase [Litoribacter ruber]|uniref:M20/M25/M40 family metallo-hydrolase n=1 Tax=Litoribacter ruber TaxID=702568 RepID=A0AAP2G2X9_9BACT|nr:MULTISPECIES: M20/M25/M40 family metallo-hydrolase [Litoribacter]MBS9522471.1 M20/M25/M40 family metallo-hydrolase [Litoribacter alkaliphilus]MBT0810991.1 M20/M25/M40 family metallo-hydrolase [Litoribacter ruber]
MGILRDLLQIQGVSGEESTISKFILSWVSQRKGNWKVSPEIYYGDELQDCIVLKFGKPRTAVFAHMDTIGFTVRYENQLVTVGGPEAEDGFELVGEDIFGPIECKIKKNNGQLFYDFPRGIQRGTSLSFKQNVRIDEKFIQAAYLDNRLGVYNAMKLCETLEDGVVVFSTYEEHHGGSMPFLLRFIYEKWQIRQSLISDITWVTEGVRHHEGVAISLRDRNIPRKAYVDRIVALASESGIPFQLEVEGMGSSDGREVQMSPYAMDWCFIGAPEDNVHSPDEKVSLHDLDCMLKMYQYLMKHL